MPHQLKKLLISVIFYFFILKNIINNNNNNCKKNWTVYDEYEGTFQLCTENFILKPESCPFPV